MNHLEILQTVFQSHDDEKDEHFENFCKKFKTTFAAR